MLTTKKTSPWKFAIAAVAAGVLLGILAFALSELLRGEFAYQGQKATALGAQLKQMYAGFIARLLARALLAYASVGVALVGASCCANFCWLKFLRKEPGLPRLLQCALFLSVLVWGLVWARQVTLSPALFAPSLYDLGGLPRALQLALIALGPAVFTCLLWAFAVTVVSGLLLAVAQRFGRRGLAIASSVLGVCALVLLFMPSLKVSRVHANTAQPNLIILAADSLRPDKLSAYGGRNPTPNLDSLAARGTRFAQAFASLPRTFPSWVTLLTGTLPSTHGIAHMFPSYNARQLAVTALPEALGKAGYTTAVVGDYAADIFSRIDLGFQRVVAPPMNMFQIIGTQTLSAHHLLFPFLHHSLARWWLPERFGWANDADPQTLREQVLQTVDDLPSDRPFMLTVFFSVTHFPYAAPYPYYKRFTDPNYQGANKFSQAHFDNGHELPAEERANINRLYDGAVAALDDAAGMLLSDLEARGKLRNTIVVVLADHGEDLHEPGVRGGHGDTLQGDASSRIPLIVSDPARPSEHGKVVTPLVRDVDLLATLAPRLGVSFPQRLEGVDLSDWMDRSATKPLSLTAFQETGIWFLAQAAPPNRIEYPSVQGLLEIDKAHGDEVVIKPEFEALVVVAKHRAVRTETEKLVIVPRNDGKRDRQLFDLVQDPNQLHDIASLHPERVTSLEAALREHLKDAAAVRMLGDSVVPRGTFGSEAQP